MPSGSNTRSRRNTSSGLTGGAGDQHAEHVGAGVVQPPLARLVEQRQRRQPAHPLVGLRRHLRCRRPAPRPSSPIASSSGCGHGAAKSMPSPRRKVRRSRTVIGRCAGHGVAVDRSPRVDEDPPVGELGQQVVDRIVEPQPALLDEDQGADRDDRLGHRRDAEDRCRGEPVAPSPRVRVPATPDLDVVVAGGQPGDAADGVALHVAGHDVAQPPEAGQDRIHSCRYLTATTAPQLIAPAVTGASCPGRRELHARRNAGQGERQGRAAGVATVSGRRSRQHREIRGSGAKHVVANTIVGTLSCIGNEQPFVGGPNAAAKIEGHCAAGDRRR